MINNRQNYGRSFCYYLLSLCFYKYGCRVTIFLCYRCGIPVILMGETGCGKTRLIRFMCELRAGHKRVRNMLLVKVMYLFFLYWIQCISLNMNYLKLLLFYCFREAS